MKGHELTAGSWKKRLPLGQEILGKGWWWLQGRGREAQALTEPALIGSTEVPLSCRMACYLLSGGRCVTELILSTW